MGVFKFPGLLRISSHALPTICSLIWQLSHYSPRSGRVLIQTRYLQKLANIWCYCWIKYQCCVDVLYRKFGMFICKYNHSVPTINFGQLLSCTILHININSLSNYPNYQMFKIHEAITKRTQDGALLSVMTTWCHLVFLDLKYTLESFKFLK